MFLVPANLFNVARQVSMLGIAAVGMAFVLLLGGIDLSIGSQITLVNIVAAWMMVHAHQSPLVACLAALTVSSFVGFLNGWTIANLRMPPLIVTLCSMTMLEGLAYIISGGMPIFGFPKAFSGIFRQGYIGPVPVPVIIMVVILAIGSFILEKTYFGRYSMRSAGVKSFSTCPASTSGGSNTWSIPSPACSPALPASSCSPERTPVRPWQARALNSKF